MSDDLINILNRENISEFNEAKKYLESQLKILQEEGRIGLGEDKNLTGDSLELRVLQIFKDIGAEIESGRGGKEDFVIIPNNESIISDNFVLEVKSHHNSVIKIADLRQLDDWVFDLSGEEQARKTGIVSNDGIVSDLIGVPVQTATRHPNPHKGVLIYNCPVGRPFEIRNPAILDNAQNEFATQRNFCVISINNLIELARNGREETIKRLYETVGEYYESV